MSLKLITVENKLGENLTNGILWPTFSVNIERKISRSYPRPSTNRQLTNWSIRSARRLRLEIIPACSHLPFDLMHTMMKYVLAGCPSNDCDGAVNAFEYLSIEGDITSYCREWVQTREAWHKPWREEPSEAMKRSSPNPMLTDDLHY